MTWRARQFFYVIMRMSCQSGNRFPLPSHELPRPMGTMFIQKAGLQHGTTIWPLQSLVFDPR